MISSLHVKGFKSLAEFSIDFEKFNCLVGLNGAGKSSVLQALDFASHLMKGDVSAWLSRRGWKPQDLHSKFSQRSNVVVFVEIKTDSGRRLLWRAAFNRTGLNCTREEIEDLDTNEILFSFFKGRYFFVGNDWVRVDFSFKGSILSTLKDDVLSPEALSVKEEVSNIRSLELLSPHLMRTTPRESSGDIGVGGEKLSPFLYDVRGDAKERLVESLKKFYPSVVDYKVKQERAGWKRLYLIEEFAGQKIETEARHVNDGLLRILAVLAQAGANRSMLLFDEIENGVNPEIIERLVEVLLASEQQVVVTTHSPLILNYLSDEVAKKSVRFVYRSSFGGTKSIPFFNMPRMKDKLKFMGPGEAFVDTSLVQLTEECIALELGDVSEDSRGGV